MQKKIPRVIIAATQSGSGKTTIVAGLIRALRDKGLTVQACKVGPDYIDPGYHRIASGRSTLNLDGWLLTPDILRREFARAAADADICIIEGVMGLYDGGKNGIGSTAEMAKLLKAPVLLVIDAKSMGESAAAIAMGFLRYDAAVHIAGVVLNRLGSDTHAAIIAAAMTKIDVPVWGMIHRDKALTVPERHLGLLPTTENETCSLIERLGQTVGNRLELDKIISLAGSAPPLTFDDSPVADIKLQFSDVCIAVAKDEAFSFYYADSLAALTDRGARLVYFSPLSDEPVPEGAAGIIIGGGFPEMFAAQLASGTAARRSIQKAAALGMPVYAECGGYMYLTEELTDFHGQNYPMTGIIPLRVKMCDKLQMVGYVTAEFCRNTILGETGDTLKGHEFHFSCETELPAVSTCAFQFTRLRNGDKYLAGYADKNILASYLHINFAATPKAVEKFLSCCRSFKEQLWEKSSW